MGWKIVRDRAQEWGIAHGVSGQWRTCKAPQAALLKKIFEEAGEYAENLDPGELYDLLDVVNRLIELTDPDYTAGTRHLDKIMQVGMFSELIEWTAMPPEGMNEVYG